MARRQLKGWRGGGGVGGGGAGRVAVHCSKGVGKEAAAAAEQSSCVVGQSRQRRAAVPGGRLIHSSAAVGEYALRG
jgi:hypothetical protein